MHHRIVSAVTAAVLCLTMLGGCASSSPSKGEPETTPSTGGEASAEAHATATDGTVFTGRWAGAFRTAYENATSQTAKDMLRDGTLSDDESQSLQTAFLRCVSDAGAVNANGGTLVTLDVNDGGIVPLMADIDDAAEKTRVQSIIDQCRSQYDLGVIAVLSSAIHASGE